MTSLTARSRSAASAHPVSRRGRGRRTLGQHLATLVLLLGAVYCLVPIFWIASASSKTPGELFTTLTLVPSFSGGFGQNFVALFEYGDNLFVRWAANSLLYAGVGALLSTFLCAMAGYALAKFRFRGRTVALATLVAGVLVPSMMLALPQYLLFSVVGIAGTPLSVLLPSLVNPLGIFLSMVYASAALPDETIEAARVDGAPELRIFGSIALQPMIPGLVTVFLLQFVGIWNNFLLPFVMISDEDNFPLTVGLFAMLNRGAMEAVLYNVVIMGALLSIIPLIVIFLVLQRYWSLDLVSGSLKG